MKRLVIAMAVIVVAMACATSVALAQPKPEFKLGFKALADQAQDVVGQPLEDERWGANGDSLQRTSKGLMVWRKADNWTAFTNGSQTWINGPEGVKSRANNERFPWETIQNYAPTAQPLYAAVFEDGKCDWEPGNLPYLKAAFEDGELHYTFVEAKKTASNTPWNEAPASFDLRAEVRFLSSGPAEAGLVFNRSSDLGTRYNFVLDSDGRYYIWIWTGEDVNMLADRRAPLFVRDGGINALRVVRAADRIAFYLNGVYLTGMSRATLTGSEVGVRMSNDEEPDVRIAWRSFAVYPVGEGSSPTVTTSGPEPGWVRLERPFEGFALSLPSTWTELSLDPAVQDESLDALRKIDPKTAEAMAAQLKQMRDSGARLFALDLSAEAGKSGYGTLANVIVAPMLAELGLDVVAQASLAELEGLPGAVKPINHRRVSTPAGEAEEFTYQMRREIPGSAPMIMSVAQYLLVKGRVQYVVSMATPVGGAEGYRQVFEKIGQSLEIR